ncbi:TPA: hypothetical protein DCZ36_01255 [Candidatus Gracilibacteria bacterium]|nr:hypothetical protein [Candidatus Gracilibacteria bacterium]
MTLADRTVYSTCPIGVALVATGVEKRKFLPTNTSASFLPFVPTPAGKVLDVKKGCCPTVKFDPFKATIFQKLEPDIIFSAPSKLGYQSQVSNTVLI